MFLSKLAMKGAVFGSAFKAFLMRTLMGAIKTLVCLPMRDMITFMERYWSIIMGEGGSDRCGDDYARYGNRSFVDRHLSSPRVEIIRWEQLKMKLQQGR